MLLRPLAAALVHQLLVLAHDRVAFLQVRLGDVVAAALLLGLGRERLVGAEQHGDAVVDAGHDERGVPGLETEDGVGAEAVAEDDRRARYVSLGDRRAQRLLEPLGAHVQLRLELVAVDAVGGAVGELADDRRTGDELEALPRPGPARLGLLVAAHGVTRGYAVDRWSDLMVAGGRCGWTVPGRRGGCSLPRARCRLASSPRQRRRRHHGVRERHPRPAQHPRLHPDAGARGARARDPRRGALGAVVAQHPGLERLGGDRRALWSASRPRSRPPSAREEADAPDLPGTATGDWPQACSARAVALMKTRAETLEAAGEVVGPGRLDGAHGRLLRRARACSSSASRTASPTRTRATTPPRSCRACAWPPHDKGLGTCQSTTLVRYPGVCCATLLPGSEREDAWSSPSRSATPTSRLRPTPSSARARRSTSS